MKHPLFTIGYAGFDLDAFVWKLKFDNIDVVVDVRDNPVSRNRAFNHPFLKSALEQKGIEYIHFQKLGVPASLRQELRSGISLAEYFDAYREYLPNAEAAASRLMPLLREKRCCLLCLEKNAQECHRSVLAEWLTARLNNAVEVRHI